MSKGIFYDRPEKYKYSMAFTSRINPIVSPDTDKYLAIASQDKFKKYLPKDIDFGKKIDFLGVCGEAFLANRLNLNDDGVKTEEALKIADLFPLSFIDANHSRKDIIGVIIQSSFAEFGTGKELTREEASKLTSPFSVVLSGIIWRIANPKLADAIEASSDPSSEWYNKLYYSWELVFSESELILIDAQKTNFEDGEIVKDPAKISELEGKLKAYGGKGIDSNGKKIGRIAIGDVIPLGLGIVEDPAGQVQPITTNINQSQASKNEQDINIKTDIIMTDIELKKLIDSHIIESLKEKLLAIKSKAAICPECGAETDEEIDDETEHSCAKCGKKSMGKMWKPFQKNKDKETEEEIKANNLQNNSNSISQSNDINVTISDNIKKFMKISKFEDLNDENIKECHAADLREVYNTEITKISKDWEAKNKEQENAIQAAKQAAQEFENKYKELETKYKEIETKHNTLASEIAQKEKVQRFSARMSTISDKFELTAEQNTIVAEEVKVIDSDDDFNKYVAKADLFFPKKGQTTQIQASTNTQQTVDSALKAANVVAPTVPNASDATTQTLADKSKAAWGIDGWTVDAPKKVKK